MKKFSIGVVVFHIDLRNLWPEDILLKRGRVEVIHGEEAPRIAYTVTEFRGELTEECEISLTKDGAAEGALRLSKTLRVTFLDDVPENKTDIDKRFDSLDDAIKRCPEKRREWDDF